MHRFYDFELTFSNLKSQMGGGKVGGGKVGGGKVEEKFMFRALTRTLRARFQMKNDE